MPSAETRLWPTKLYFVLMKGPKVVGWLLAATWTYHLSLIWRIGSTIFNWYSVMSRPMVGSIERAEHDMPILEGESPPSVSPASSLTVNLSEGSPPNPPLPEPPQLIVGPDEQDFQGMGVWGHFCNGAED
ncbi:uncharacterized protein Z519_10903 [Cladophialophora bantiana CBS 173.52]|uniref:Uncharacterized protein n=1 Tax=Cladophialophora bantiana (strain ATCC 10958 / CBS 173.52 / CDC B-1940 / NIH 8579) TaxID=1442370 RepID=A0A0D2HBN4_CLAB1|nr:uncharacterized protein Z519_10903 [Cladophialophora bantiana CBS 173.52]KIW88335.1 hypothetical protein Z519_10903 [Cladophialophora bantiana CBS 173.52]